MSKDYVRAKNIALGKVMPTSDHESDAIWDVSPRPLSLQAELSEQLFKREFAPPDEILAHKTALSLYDAEYDGDRKAATKHFAVLSEALNSGNTRAVARLLRRHPTPNWLSHIFLSEPDISKTLLDAIRTTNDACRDTLRAALRKGRSILVNYTQLHDSLLEYIERTNS